jgi:hypothetical protein
VTLRFSPDGLRSFLGEFTAQVATGAANGFPVKLRGRGVHQLTKGDLTFAGTGLLADEALDFGGIRAGTTKTLPLKVRNVGTSDLRVTVALGTPTRVFTFTPQPRRVLAGSDATINVTFLPPAGVAGMYLEILEIADPLTAPAHRAAVVFKGSAESASVGCLDSRGRTDQDFQM